jgi:hypothetical protein
MASRSPSPLLALTLLLACADNGTPSDDEVGNDSSTDSTGTTDSTGSSTDSTGESTGSDATDDTTDASTDSETGDGDGDFWDPGETLPTPREPNARGLLDRRGLIHAHSVHSHDACDDMPKDDMGNFDTVCDHDFREGLCRSRHDFVFLTDHTGTFAEVEYPDTLLYRPLWGDELVEVDGEPVANWTGCNSFETGKSGSAPFVPALIMAGCESETMPVGLPAHVAATPEERSAIYGSASPDAIMALRDAGAISLVAHTEDWTVQELVDLPLQGFEMYNVHANLFANIVPVGELLVDLASNDGLPHPDLILLVLMSEDPAYLDTWSAVLASGVERVTTMGTDCHRNTFPQMLEDGDRIDSFERLMKWFGNHLLIEPDGQGEWGPDEAREALAGGRLYGVFEFLGHPEGFDYVAEQNGDVFEMGSVLSLAEGAVSLRVVAPVVMARDPSTPTPVVQVRLLKADPEGWDEVGLVANLEGTVEDLVVEIAEPGAYRAEVRLLAHHLEGQLGKHEELLDDSTPWVYANAIYVRE